MTEIEKKQTNKKSSLQIIGSRSFQAELHTKTIGAKEERNERRIVGEQCEEQSSMGMMPGNRNRGTERVSKRPRILLRISEHLRDIENGQD